MLIVNLDVAEGGAIGGVVTNQPLPSEFERQRKAHSQSAAAMQPTRRNENYRVDNLPESLWEEALTVAAQTYNAAKVAVENLADTFVPVKKKSPILIIKLYRIILYYKESILLIKLCIYYYLYWYWNYIYILILDY